MISVLFIALAITSSNALSLRGCRVSINGDLAEPQPLILRGKGANLSFVLPVDTSGTLSFEADEEFRLACTGHNNHLVNVRNNDVQDIEAYCIDHTRFLVDSRIHEFSDLVCSFLTESVARVRGKTCLGKYTQVDIGFQVSENELLRTIEVCRDDITYVTYYARFNLTKTIGGRQTGYVRPGWIQGDFYSPFSLNKQYNRAVQIATVSQVLKSTDLGDKYISRNSDYFLSRSHLVSNADFVYGVARWSTFWYVNAAPQWQTFNGGNWKHLEMDVRSYASSKQLNLDVYTGTHGITSLLDTIGLEHPLYFYASGNERALPVPKFFWKILYDPTTKKGTVFVGINDPYLARFTHDNDICNDISDQISWLTWSARNVSLGVSYVCTIEDFRKVVKNIPNLEVSGILT